jgi:mannose-6-phosphate isomerase-like protein (cupin superfamily)
MHAFEASDLLEAQRRAQRAYHEFLRVPALSCGIYVVPAGGHDPQQPHGQDEIYYVLGGEGAIRVGDEVRPLQPGSLVYVPAEVPHRFIDITTELELLVLFAPAEHNASS